MVKIHLSGLGSTGIGGDGRTAEVIREPWFEFIETRKESVPSVRTARRAKVQYAVGIYPLVRGCKPLFVHQPK